MALALIGAALVARGLEIARFTSGSGLTRSPRTTKLGSLPCSMEHAESVEALDGTVALGSPRSARLAVGMAGADRQRAWEGNDRPGIAPGCGSK